MNSSLLYLDNNATTPLAPEVRAAVLPYLDDAFGNPSSANRLGQQAKEALLSARRNLATALDAAPAEIVFTSGATESNHTAILGALQYFGGQRRHIVASAVEHASTLKLLDWLEQQGTLVTRIAVDNNGNPDLDELRRAVTPHTALVSIMWVNNETGVIHPVETIAEIAKTQGALFHTDAVQAIGKLPLSWRHSNIDLLTLSGHKLHAPKGSGALIVRKGLTLPPLLFGSQERHRRGGTENMIGIVGLGAAAALFAPQTDAPRMQYLRDRFEQRICTALNDAAINGWAAPRIANTSNLRFGRLDSEMLLQRLEQSGVIAASGSACQSGGNAPSHVLRAMGLSSESAMASLRFSLSRYHTENEIDEATARIIRTVRELEQELLSTSTGHF